MVSPLFHRAGRARGLVGHGRRKKVTVLQKSYGPTSVLAVVSWGVNQAMRRSRQGRRARDPRCGLFAPSLHAG